MTKMTRSYAAVSTCLILIPFAGFLYICFTAWNISHTVSLIAAGTAALVLVPMTYRFSLQEAELQNGDSDADRKD